MPDLAQDPGIETGAGWTFVADGAATASRTTLDPFEGAWHGRVQRLADGSVFGGFRNSSAVEDLDAPPVGVDLLVSLMVKRPSGGCGVALDVDPGGGAFTVTESLAPAEVGSAYAAWELDPVPYEGPNPPRVRVRPVSGTAGTIYFDLVRAEYVSQEELMARCNMPTFLANLGAAWSSLDPNLGPLLLAERRWTSDVGLTDDGAILTIEGGGLFDEVEATGEKATRFWIAEPILAVSPLTTGSTEYRGTVRLLGFFVHKDPPAPDQGVALRRAVEEVLAHVTEKAVELGTLAAGMGDGYQGFLTTLPRMIGPVRQAELGIGSVRRAGWAVQIEITYFEEVAR